MHIHCSVHIYRHIVGEEHSKNKKRKKIANRDLILQVIWHIYTYWYRLITHTALLLSLIFIWFSYIFFLRKPTSAGALYHKESDAKWYPYFAICDSNEALWLWYTMCDRSGAHGSIFRNNFRPETIWSSNSTVQILFLDRSCSAIFNCTYK